MAILTEQPDGSLVIAVKAVPGASRDQVVGALGERLKVKVAAPPEGGKANRAICALLAERLGLRTKDCVVVAGGSAAEKQVRVVGITAARAKRLLGLG